jgi:hypothetical protein
MKNLALVSLLFLVAGLLQLSAVAADKKDGKKGVRYEVTFVATDGTMKAGIDCTIDIIIDEFTSDEEYVEQLAILKSKGQEALRRKLEKIKKGRILWQYLDQAGISIARISESETGTIVKLFTVQPWYFLQERFRGEPSRDYPFGMIEMRIDKTGKGQGAIAVSAKAMIREGGGLELVSQRNEYMKIHTVRRVY